MKFGLLSRLTDFYLACFYSRRELGLYIVCQLITHRLSLSSDIITGDLEKHPFV